MDTFIGPTDLARRLNDADTRVIDVRWDLDDEAGGFRAYRSGHVPGAVYLGWLTDWSDPHDSTLGQLAPPRRFAAMLGRAGIGPDTRVVVYDDGGQFMAARFLWAMHHYGHTALQILAGGYRGWLAAGLPTSLDTPHVEPRRYPVPRPGRLRATMREVMQAMRNGSAAIVDCRVDSTYVASGEHIPGASRLPASDLFDAGSGLICDPEMLRRRAEAAGITDSRPTILYCGGGVAAAAVHVALREIGIRDAQVYDGSWAEWSAHQDAPREQHSEPDRHDF